MQVFKLSIPFALLMLASTAGAQQRLEINNIYPLNQENVKLSDSVYHTTDNRGYFEVVQGPFEDGPVRCTGSGFAYADGTNTIDGICIYGEGEDTFIMRWKAGEKGKANTWAIVSGTGLYDGLTGEGIATTGVEVMFKAMPLRQTHVTGTVSLSAQ